MPGRGGGGESGACHVAGIQGGVPGLDGYDGL